MLVSSLCACAEPIVALINPRRACAARVMVLCRLSSCLSVRRVRRLANLAVQGTGRPMTATNRFRVARSDQLKYTDPPSIYIDTDGSHACSKVNIDPRTDQCVFPQGLPS